jgi:uncharacterized protein
VSEGFNEPSSVVRRHIDAFNARDLDALIACFSTDVTWITGTDSFHGSAALRELFAAAFAELSPRLHLLSLAAEGGVVACELREDYSAAGGGDRTDHIAGFYRVDTGLIVAAKIYREGSADVA